MSLRDPLWAIVFQIRATVPLQPLGDCVRFVHRRPATVQERAVCRGGKRDCVFDVALRPALRVFRFIVAIHAAVAVVIGPHHEARPVREHGEASRLRFSHRIYNFF